MPKYSYTAVDISNKKTKSALDAKDEDDLKRILRNRGLVLIKYKEIQERRGTYRLNSKEVSEFSRQLASMLSSGITVVRAFEILKNRDFKRELLNVYAGLHADIQQGYTVSEAMRMQGNVFPELFINMYASAEASGQLDLVAEKMAFHYEKEHKLNSKVKSAMVYPILLLVVTAAVVLIIFTFVLPELFGLFEGIELPPATRVIMAISGFFKASWYWVIIGILIAFVIIRVVLRMDKVRLFVDKAKLKFPIVGKLLKIIYTARFSRTLSSLYSSGVSMITALEITATIIGNKYLESQFSAVITDVRNGNSLSDAVGAIKGFDTKLSASVLIGEESGRLDSMLNSIADSFDYEAEIATDRLVQLLQPVMIIFLAVVVGIIILSVIQPVMTIYNSIGTL